MKNLKWLALSMICFATSAHADSAPGQISKSCAEPYKGVYSNLMIADGATCWFAQRHALEAATKRCSASGGKILDSSVDSCSMEGPDDRHAFNRIHLEYRCVKVVEGSILLGNAVVRELFLNFPGIPQGKPVRRCKSEAAAEQPAAEEAPEANETSSVLPAN